MRKKFNYNGGEYDIEVIIMKNMKSMKPEKALQKYDNAKTVVESDNFFTHEEDYKNSRKEEALV